jgi:hypothetical protein
MCVDCVLASLRIAQADPGRRTPPIGGFVIVGYQSKLEATHQYLKIITTLSRWVSLSPYKDYSLLRWQANCVYILQLWNCVNEGMLWFLRVLDLFCCWWPYFVVCGFCRTIRNCVCFFLFMEIILLFTFTCRNLLVKSPLGWWFQKPIIWGC